MILYESPCIHSGPEYSLAGPRLSSKFRVKAPVPVYIHGDAEYSLNPDYFRKFSKIFPHSPSILLRSIPRFSFTRHLTCCQFTSPSSRIHTVAKNIFNPALALDSFQKFSKISPHSPSIPLRSIRRFSFTKTFDLLSI
jgi:hypothetical protein